jgi:TatD DNase family protein
MHLTDTHAHLYHARFDADREAVIARAREHGVQRIVLPNIDRSSIQPMLDLAATHPMYCLPTMGIHPCSIGPEAEAELIAAESWLFRPPKPLPEGMRFWAVGEIGLDFYWDKTHIEAQEKALARQLDWAMTLDLPVLLHTREANDATLDLVEAAQRHADGRRLRGIYHCFSGTVEQAERAVAQGFLLGIGGVATFKNGGLDRILPGIALEHLVLETDAPYLAPTPHRGKRNEPAYTALVAERLASWYGTTPQAIAEATSANAARLFGW